MIARHVGQKPKYKLKEMTSKDGQKATSPLRYYEKYPEGSAMDGRYWTKRQLLGGCGGDTEYRLKKGLLYCEDCNEWFKLDDFEVLDGR